MYTVHVDGYIKVKGEVLYFPWRGIAHTKDCISSEICKGVERVIQTSDSKNSPIISIEITYQEVKTQ